MSGGCPSFTFLPVDIISFTATYRNNYAVLRWEITNPFEAADFLVQRKTGNDGWQDIKQLNAGENITVYNYNDAGVAEGLYHFRLKLTEKNGRIVYSNIVPLRIDAARNEMKIYPNPANEIVSFIYPFRKGDEVRIVDAAGRLVKKLTIKSDGPLIRENLASLRKGVYFIRYKNLSAKLVLK
jgi:hypothetical protein